MDKRILLLAGTGLGIFLLTRQPAGGGSVPAGSGLTADQLRMAPGYPQISVAQARAWGYVNAQVGQRVTRPGDPGGAQYLIAG